MVAATTKGRGPRDRSRRLDMHPLLALLAVPGVVPSRLRRGKMDTKEWLTLIGMWVSLITVILIAATAI